MKIVGERALNPVVEPLEATRKVKVKEAFDQAVVKCKAGSTAPKPPPPAPKEGPPAKKKASALVKKETRPTSPALVDEPSSTAPRAKPPARLMVCLLVNDLSPALRYV
jgi:cytoskeleton-associated protein 5